MRLSALWFVSTLALPVAIRDDHGEHCERLAENTALSRLTPEVRVRLAARTGDGSILAYLELNGLDDLTSRSRYSRCRMRPGSSSTQTGMATESAVNTWEYGSSTHHSREYVDRVSCRRGYPQSTSRGPILPVYCGRGSLTVWQLAQRFMSGIPNCENGS